MILLPRRLSALVPLFAVALFLLALQTAVRRRAWRAVPQVVGLGELVDDDGQAAVTSPAAGQAKTGSGTGVIKGIGANYTKTLVVAKVKKADTKWLDEALPSGWTSAVYVADDRHALLHPPVNKGNEVMVYLTYIIDHYDVLPEIVAFMHSHRYAWHNNDLLNNDAVEMLLRLSSERVVREGYMNLRCHWNPGCPSWIHPGRVAQDGDKREEKELARAWAELFPQDPIPLVLAQPCCSQFALSRDRIRAMSKERYVYLRNWLIRTDLSTYLSGRVFEYIWHYVFTGANEMCPDQHVCYCDGYGICFDDGSKFDFWFELRFRMGELQEELDKWEAKAKRIEEAKKRGGVQDGDKLDIPEAGRDTELRNEINAMQSQMDRDRNHAVKRGNDPRVRAHIAGRQWHDGDWY